MSGYEYAVVSIYGTLEEPSVMKVKAHRLTPQGHVLFWTGVRVKDPLNAKQSTKGLDRALGSLLDLGWECIGRDLRCLGHGIPEGHALIRKYVESGPVFEYAVLSWSMEEKKKGGLFSRSVDEQIAEATVISPQGAITIKQKLLDNSESSDECLDAFGDELFSDGWQEVAKHGGDYTGSEKFLVREIQAQNNVTGGARNQPKEQGGNQDALAVLEGLAKLRDAGAISEEEFEAKKTEILSRL